MHATMHSCSIEDVPLQRWTNLIISLDNRALDLYLDGKLVRTCVLPGVPKMNPASNILGMSKWWIFWTYIQL
jgi:hypothetical protein